MSLIIYSHPVRQVYGYLATYQMVHISVWPHIPKGVGMKSCTLITKPLTALFLVLTVTSASAQNNFYGIGASILAGADRWIGLFLTVKGMSGSSDECSITGAPVNYIWDNRAAKNPNPETYLQTHSVDVLFLCPAFDDRGAEPEKQCAAAVANFANAAIQGNPNVRVFIEERYNVEPGADGLWRFCFFEGSCAPTETIDNLFRPKGLRTARMAATGIGRPVYDVPVASAVEAVKQLITAGELDNYHSRMDLHIPDGHLNAFGQYVMAATVWAAAYHQDPRTLPITFTSWFIETTDHSFTMSSHDAALVNQAIYDVVKGRSFSGWHGDEPTSYAAYQDSMAAALTNYETFENIDVVAGSGDDYKNGSFVGQDSIAWTYHHGWGSEYSGLVISEETMILAEARTGDPSYLWAAIPNGISELTFQYRGRYRPPTSETYKYRLAVMAGADTIAVLNKILDGDTIYARRLEHVSLPPGGTLKFVNTGNDAAKIDNLKWTDYAGPTGSVQKEVMHKVFAPHISFRNGVLSIPSGNSRLDIATLDGRTLWRQGLKGESAVRLALKPGVYVATVSGAARSESSRLMVR
jgi:hypothetical protein